MHDPLYIIFEGDPDTVAAWCAEQFGPARRSMVAVSLGGGWSAQGAIFAFANANQGFAARMRWGGRVYNTDSHS